MPNGHILSRRYARRLRKRLRQPLDRHQHADAPNGLLSFAIFFEMLAGAQSSDSVACQSVVACIQCYLLFVDMLTTTACSGGQFSVFVW